MRKIIEVKETIYDSKLIDNIYATNRIMNNIVKQTEFTTEINRSDYNYLNIIMEKTRIALEKAYEVLKNN